MPVLVHGLALSGWTVFLDEELQYVLVKELEGFIAGEMGAVFDDGPVVSVAEDLAAEASAGGDGGVDLFPEGLEVVWGAEGEAEAGVDEVGFGDLEALEVGVVDGDAVFGGCSLDLGSCIGSFEAVVAAVLCPDGPSGFEEGDGVSGVAASEIDGVGWVCGVDVALLVVEQFDRFEDGVAWGLAFHAVEVRGPISAVGGFVDRRGVGHIEMVLNFWAIGDTLWYVSRSLVISSCA